MRYDANNGKMGVELWIRSGDSIQGRRDVWDAVLEKATEISALYNSDSSIPRRTGRRQHRANVEAGTSS